MREGERKGVEEGRVARGRVEDGKCEEGTERGMDLARERGGGGSDRRSEERGEQQSEGVSEGGVREQGGVKRQGMYTARSANSNPPLSYN